jgi:single-stranded-DNA-specific exonuclease
MEYNWNPLPEPDPEVVRALQASLNVSIDLVRLLAQRGICDFESARSWFRPALADLHDPFLMSGMKEAVTRLQKAINRRERILFFGDYDVDGTTAVSLMASYFKTLYTNFETYIPDRYLEGYGVSKAGIDFAHANGCRLIVALDCGVKAIDKVAYAKSLGIDFIICDHHTPGHQLPDAVAVLDPKRTDCPYPYKELSGCGVGFKLVQAFHAKLGGDFEDLVPLLDLLAVSIGADIVPITGENRILAHFGMLRLNQSPRPGLKALMEDAGAGPFNITNVVFVAGPRINAAGRMDHGKLAVALLTSEDPQATANLATEVRHLNTQRRQLDQSITQQALMQMEADSENRHATVVYREDWSKGVIGIVASRLIENCFRPTIVLTKSGKKLAGSARSIPNFDLYEALEQCQAHLEQFGGHKYAAGMTLFPEQLPAFKAAFDAAVGKLMQPEWRMPVHTYDLEVALDAFDASFYRIMQQFGPFGPENMDPVFRINNLHDTGESRKVGGDQTHLKVQLVDRETGTTIDGIAFKMAHSLEILQSGPVDILTHLDENVWRGTRRLQLRIIDIAPAGSKTPSTN